MISYSRKDVEFYRTMVLCRNHLRKSLGDMYQDAIAPVKAVLLNIQDREKYTSPLEALSKALEVCDNNSNPSPDMYRSFLVSACLEMYEDEERR